MKVIEYVWLCVLVTGGYYVTVGNYFNLGEEGLTWLTMIIITTANVSGYIVGSLRSMK